MKRASLQRKKMTGFKLLLFCVVVAMVVFLVACAPRPAGSTSGDNEGQTQNGTEAVPIDWSVDTDCGVCHTVEQGTADTIPCESSQSSGSVCVTCHISDEAQMIEVHEGVTTDDTVPKRLKATEVSDETCLACHYETKEALVTATDGIAMVTDKNGLSLNPHNPGSSGTSHAAITCASCHSFHDGSNPLERAQAKCESCHHEKVFECNTCHEA